MSDITINCPGCNQQLEVPEDMLGQVVECPACNQSLQLLDPEPDASVAGSKKKIVMHKRKKMTRSPRSFNKTISSSSRHPSSPQGKNKACPFCGEEILSVAVKCKHCGEKMPNKKEKISTDISIMRIALLFFLVLAGIVALSTLAIMKSDDRSDRAEQKFSPPAPKHDAVSAWTMCQLFVEDQLKSPSSAKWSWQNARDNVEHLGGGRYRIKAHVDSQNSFGAMLRSHFIAEVRYLPDNDKWSLESLVFQE